MNNMSIDNLEKRIATLADIEAIKQLKARYCNICDNGYDPDEIIKLFTEDGTWEGGEFGTATGPAAIARIFEGLNKAVSFAQHNALNPIIEVNGDRATAGWYLFCPYTSRKDNAARWIAGRYEDDHVKVNGEWKYKRLRAIIRMHAPYEKGWAIK
jgi:SnoaL-like domain